MRFFGGNIRIGQLFMASPFCSVHIIVSWLCACLRVVAPLLSDLFEVDFRWSQLVGKYGPNLGLSVGLVFCLSELWSEFRRVSTST